MYRIMLVDDKLSNNQTLEMLIESYLDKKSIDFDLIDIVSVDSGTAAIKLLFQEQNFDLMFLDLMMPKMSGMDVLEIIRSANLDKFPKIVICTALDDYDIRVEAEAKRANAFITKPVNSKMVEAMLDVYMQNSLNTYQSQFDDEFFDFDDMEDFAFSNTQKETIAQYNDTHLKVSAKEFLQDIDNVEFIIEDTAEIENDLERIIASLEVESTDTLDRESIVISECIGKYASLLNGFVEFYELSLTLRALSNIIYEANFDKMDTKHKQNIMLYIKAILSDISNWRENVFIKQDAIDVYYLNASVLSSCMQLEDMIKKSYEL